jgi:formylglycine-generating enzyme required for sulfatase activity
MGSPETEAGRFTDEGLRHEVTMTGGCWMADSPVTQALYLEVMGNNPSRFAGPAHPVETVVWEEAVAFCAALDARLRAEGVPEDGLCFRLPTEAEWERACRAGTETATYNGDLTLRGRNDAPELGSIAWTYANSDGTTRPVKQKKPNAWGLYDMLGNVGEWCQDAVEGWEDYPDGPRVDPVGQSGPERACRGGSWWEGAWVARAGFRDLGNPALSWDNLGLRLSRGCPHPQ